MNRPTPVLVKGEETRVRTRSAVSGMFLTAGAAFALVGLADIALLWYPPHAGSVAWEYATVGRTLDALPMPTLGLLLVAYGVLRQSMPTRRGVAVASLMFGLWAVFGLFLAFLIFTSAPAVLSQSPPEAVEALRRSALRHGVQAILYPLAWTVIAVLIWKVRGPGTAE